MKQLSMKFLSKEEIRGFKFQKAFLKPFETIIKQTNGASMRELILMVVKNMVLGRAANIRSGWKNILVVLGTAASDTRSALVKLGFSVAESLVKQHFVFIRGDFVDLLSCLLAFARGCSLRVSLQAIDLLRRCAVHLALGHVPLAGTTATAPLTSTAAAAAIAASKAAAAAAAAAGGAAAKAASSAIIAAAGQAAGGIPMDKSALDIISMSEEDFERILDRAQARPEDPPVLALGQTPQTPPTTTTTPTTQAAVQQATISGGNGNVGDFEDDEDGDQAQAAAVAALPATTAAVAALEAEMSHTGIVSQMAVTRYTAKDSDHVAVWWPLLMGLVDLVVDRRLEVRIRAVQVSE